MNLTSDLLTSPDRDNSFLLTIDVQADFTNPGAPAEIPGTAAAVPNMVRLINAFRAAGRPVIHMVRLYKEDGSNVDLCRRQKAMRGWNVACPDTPGAELVAEFNVPERLDASLLLNGLPQKIGEHEWILYKPRWSAFYQTPLDKMISWLQLNTAVICGCNFPNCPRATIYEASERDLRVVVASDALSGLYDQGRAELQNIGVELAETQTCLTWLNTP
ncbi:MAG: isochorismatase family cysteine hydrolase [Acidobacteriota bacterium]